MVSSREKQQLRQQIEATGYSVKITGWPARMTYYKPTGEAMPGLPSDEVSLRGYLGKGFTLQPPAPGTEKPVRVIPSTAQGASPVTAPVVPAASAPSREFLCGICGKEAKSLLGLNSHSRQHVKENTNVIS